MKIKTLFICFLAVCAMSLTSCKKENYAEKFVGSYNASLTPDLTLSIPMMDIEEVFEGEKIEPLTFEITQVGETQDVNVTFSIPELLLKDLEDLYEVV